MKSLVIRNLQNVKELKDRLSIAENNLIIETFRRMIGDAQTGADPYQDGWVDTLQDESNIDLNVCSNQVYDSTDDCYKFGTLIGVLDSYSESNDDDNWQMYHGHYEQVGQTFTISSTKVITSAKFYLQCNSCSADVRAKIYAATGTVGSNAIPTGSVLATSNDVDITDASSQELIEFTFPTPCTLSPGNYCVLVEYTAGDGGHNVLVGTDHSSPSHYGNTFYTNTADSGWSADNSYDVCFYLYGRLDTILIFNGYEVASDPSSTKAVLVMEEIDPVKINTDLKAWGSLDDGAHYEQIPLKDIGDFSSGKKILVGSKDLTDRNDKTTRLKITSHNGIRLKIHEVANLLQLQ